MATVAFWLALAASAIAVIVTGYLSRLAAERTVRLAIEQGLVKDAETLAKLMAPRGLAWPLRLIVLGLVIVFAGAGVALFALSLHADEPQSTPSMLGIAGFVVLLGAGFLTAGVWLRRAHGGPP